MTLEARSERDAATFGREARSALLLGGRRFCAPYPDLAKPTSDAISRRIGSCGIGDEAHLRFDA